MAWLPCFICMGVEASLFGKLRGSPEEEAFIHLPVVAELLPCLIPSALLCEVPKALCRPRQAEGVEEPTWKEALRLFAERLGSLQTSYVISSVRKERMFLLFFSNGPFFRTIFVSW